MCESGAVRYAKNMCVDRYGRFAECRVKNNTGCLSSDAGQGFQSRTRCGDFADVFLKDNSAGLDNIFGLAVVQANTLYIMLQSGHAEVEYCLRRVGYREKNFCCFVDANVCRLRRQNDGHE